MSNPPSQGAAPPQQQQGMQLLKTDDIPKLQCLNNDMKQKYRPIVQNLWQIIQTKPQGSAEYTQARAKLQDWSQKLIAQERQHRAKIKQQQSQNQGQPAQQGQTQQTPQSQQGQQGQQSQPGQPALQQPPQQAPSQLQPQLQPPMQQPANPAQQPRPPQANPQQPTVDPEIIKHVQGFKFYLPANGPLMGTPDGDAKIKEMRNSYLMALNRQQKATQRIKMLNNMAEQKQQAGQEVPQELITQKQNMEKEYNTAKEFVENFRRKQGQNKIEQDQRRSQQPGQAQPNQQLPPTAPPQQRQPPQPTVKEEPQIKIEGGQMQQAPLVQQQQPQQPPPPPQPQPQPQQQQFASMPSGPPAQQPGPAPSLPQQQQQQRPPLNPHQPNSMPQQTQNPQFVQPGPPQPHQQQRPPLNPHPPNSMPQVHQQNHAQSATPTASNVPPAPLSHQAAVSAAQRSYSNQEAQRTTTPMQGGAQGNFHTPGSREREQLNNPKMPIPRNLPPMPTQPVGMGQARPTMSGPTNGAPGPMGQPVISKFPPFQLEGENDRVLSKRKLDELVRQVTGGSEEALTPEVEEAVLQLADDFVDTVIGNACKLSKLRESSQLDVRDIQMVLERNYNIRIPGYASDEVRTVRRLVPAPGWTQKMNAVQAAKVMGGKNDI
ncbi:hypothetical protein P280DRAFT_469704 [Massarina eburnea CBS 473.64]|uniref:Transcription initiation factor TFIID subunit 12 domain-containing protein n=1 Tax=Massarina eburnea CBS 473.64 TaxID=1395130 RepID=A0A6A6RYB6_9PLEO|nr:hypothetical protein P280DRAFT_469704 [Massarina eburnea CBS 473.64]